SFRWPARLPPVPHQRACMSRMGVVVVSFNAREDLLACLRSIRQAAASPPPTVLVDNGSTDGGPDLVRLQLTEVEVVIDPANRAYGAAANLGARRHDWPYLLLLNSDTVLAAGAVDALSDYLDAHPRVAIVGPRLLAPDAVLEPSCHPPLGTVRS